ncbi:MAG: aldolase/citrate lyase family protein [Candidatus Korobacteraceae bacterium]|jgi:4-hydroxy-2-oxoheptanedioate aldolase
MRENKLRTIWKQGGCVVNGWLTVPSSFSAEVMAHTGWDSLCIDIQHGMVDFQTAISMMQAISTTSVTPIVRVPWNEPGIIMKCLDAGAYGVICPMINTRADAERLVATCHYPPAGFRSCGPTRAVLYGGSDYQAKANETIVAFAMIETAEALANIDSILSTPGLDAIFIGPNDLAISMGLPNSLDPTESKVADAISQILAACRRHGVKAGIHTGSAANAKAMIAKGFDFVTILSDARILAQAASALVADVKTAATAAVAK